MNKTLVRLTETAIMIALGTVLSIVKLVDLPYGGSITAAHMLPVMIIAYRYGATWGFCSGAVYGALQLLLGMKNLSYATSIWAAIAIIVLDYLLAYVFVGTPGFFKGKSISQPAGLTLGVFIAMVLRYFCHVIAGCTVWAGLSIPTAAALTYSLVYNATYMIPETIVTVLAALYIGSVLDFSSPRLKRLEQTNFSLSSICFNLIGVAAFIADVCLFFGVLQNEDDGTFTTANLSSLSWTWIGGLAIIGVACFIFAFIFKKRPAEQAELKE